jgi:hypothetical protein
VLNLHSYFGSSPSWRVRALGAFPTLLRIDAQCMAVEAFRCAALRRNAKPVPSKPAAGGTTGSAARARR